MGRAGSRPTRCDHLHGPLPRAHAAAHVFHEPTRAVWLMECGVLLLISIVLYGARPAHEAAHVFSRAGPGRGS